MFGLYGTWWRKDNTRAIHRFHWDGVRERVGPPRLEMGGFQ